jgi:hypothetical protein
VSTRRVGGWGRGQLLFEARCILEV